MWGLLKRLSSDCWGNHDWIAKANTNGLWLECRHCGQESTGVELPPVRYHRTQDGVDDAHRLGGMPPARRAARARAAAVPPPLRFSDRKATGAPVVAAATPRPAVPSPAVATTAAEHRWLQMFRTMTPDERRLAERMVASLRAAAGDQVRTDGERDERLTQGRLVG